MDGKFLYCCGLNDQYKLYVAKKGGFNLYDAVEFKKFRRVDLYAENILSVIDSLTLYARHSYMSEVLVLLLIQYLSVHNDGKLYHCRLTCN